MKTKKAVHFIGIGGAGMSGIAQVMLEMGYDVSGSDIKHSRYTDNLEKSGAEITIGHRPENINNQDTVVISSAIPADNKELLRARELGLPVLARAQMLARLSSGRWTVAVAGTHGKTTTSSMISFILKESGADPTYLIGGELNDVGGNAHYGQGRFCVIEADESDGSLLYLRPRAAVITNIDADHLDYYGTVEKIIETFNKWLRGLPGDGAVYINGDGKSGREAVAGVKCRVFTYGLSRDNDYFAADLKKRSFGTVFKFNSRDKGCLGEIELQVPGRHNVVNAAAAAAFCLTNGIEFAAVKKALAAFKGVKRRFQILNRNGAVTVVDDYAHHPTEIKATLQAARQVVDRRVICVFQPHRYSRTQLLSDEFGGVFKNADVTVITDVYSAGEEPIPGVTGKLLVDAVARRDGRQKLVYLPGKLDIQEYLLANVRRGDLVLTMGAGDIWTVGAELLSGLEKRGGLV